MSAITRNYQMLQKLNAFFKVFDKKFTDIAYSKRAGRSKIWATYKLRVESSLP